MYDLPTSVWALVLIGVIGIPAATCVALYRGAIVAGLGRGVATSVTAATAGVLGGWLLISGSLAAAGVYSGRQGGLWIVLAFASFLLTLLLATRIPVMSRILADPGTARRLALPHTLRVVGVLFLIVMALGHLPAAFALPAGLGDIAIGMAAPFVARRLAREPGDSAAVSAAVRFNVLGLLDLVVAVSLGFLLGPSGPLDVTPSTAPLRLLPLGLIATTAVPLAMALHIVSIGWLRAGITRVTTADTTTWHPRGSREAVRS